MIKKIIFFIAVSGWIASMVVNILSIADIDVVSKFPFILLLHFGIFVVWLPTILELQNAKANGEFKMSRIVSQMNPINFFNMLFKNTPTYLKIIAIGGFFYAITNHVWTLETTNGTADIKEGQYILHNHGNLIRNLTEQEYHHFKALSARGFSAVWLVFYGIAMAVLFPFKKKDDETLIN